MSKSDAKRKKAMKASVVKKLTKTPAGDSTKELAQKIANEVIEFRNQMGQYFHEAGDKIAKLEKRVTDLEESGARLASRIESLEKGLGVQTEDSVFEATEEVPA